MSRSLIYMTIVLVHQLSFISGSNVDFILDHISPDESNFSCETVKDGIYADVESDCRKFYVCEKTVKYHFSCPLGMRFYQRFETCSYIPPEEEASFNCNEMTSHEARSLKSQSLNSEEISEDTESHDLERRDDQSSTGSDEVVVSDHTSDQLASLLMQPQMNQGHFPELTFLTDEQGPAYLIFDHEELVPKSQERHHQEQQEHHSQQDQANSDPQNANPIHSNSDVSPHQVPSATYSLCQLAKFRTKRDLRCV